jgi:hypothetical protein
MPASIDRMDPGRTQSTPTANSERTQSEHKIPKSELRADPERIQSANPESELREPVRFGLPLLVLYIVRVIELIALLLTLSPLGYYGICVYVYQCMKHSLTTFFLQLKPILEYNHNSNAHNTYKLFIFTI